jgi:sugar phosphate isomerase/epimerase
MIAVSCPGFSMTPFKEMAEVIEAHFDSWEIIAEGMHFLPDIANELVEWKASRKLHFSVHAPFSDLNIASLNSRARKEALAQVIETIKICSELDIEIITVHPGYKSPLGAYFPEKVKKIHVQSLLEIDKAGEDYGVVLALENIPKMWISLCAFAQEMESLIEGTNLKICFDFGHANISDDISGFIKLKSKIANLHLHDNRGEKDRHMILGEGNIDFSGIFKEFKGYKGNYVIESMNLEEGIRSKAVLEALLEEI